MRLVALAAAAVVAAAWGIGGQGAAPAPRVRAAPVAGNFSQSNSRDASPIFTAAGIGPGDTAAGTVTIANNGALGGDFALAQADVAGPLAARLILTVREQAASAPVYSGRFDSLGNRALGWFAPGEARTYQFTTAFPHGAGDNAFMATTASARFVWTAVEAPRPLAPDGAEHPATGGDRRPPALRLSIPPVQRVATRGYLLVRARCDERCGITAGGQLRIRGVRNKRLPTLALRAAPRRWVTFRMRIPHARRPALLRTLRRGRRATIALRVSARDDRGNTRVALHTVRLRRAGRR